METWRKLGLCYGIIGGKPLLKTVRKVVNDDCYYCIFFSFLHCDFVDQKESVLNSFQTFDANMARFAGANLGICNL